MTAPLFFLLALVAGASGAQNLIANPDFDNGLTGWQTSYGGAWSALADSGGCLLSSAAGGTSTLGGGGDPIMGLTSQQCIVVDPVATPTLYLGVEPQLFLDGFEPESGTTCYWSNVVGEL